MIFTARLLPDGRLLTASRHGFAVWDGGTISFGATFDRIARVFAWQQDLVTYWWDKVILPPFGSNQLVVFERAGG